MTDIENLLKQHLTEEEVMGFVEGEPSPELRARVEAHIEHCEPCAAEIEGYLELEAEHVEWTERNAASLSDFASRLVAEGPTPPAEHEGLSGDDLRLLELLGRTLSLSELVLANRLDRAKLDASLASLKDRLLGGDFRLLAMAEEVARALAGQAFDRWKEPAPSVGAVRNQHPSSEADPVRLDYSGHGWIPNVAASPRDSARPPLEFEDRHKQRPEYALVVREVRRRRGWFTEIRLAGPGDPPWGFRLTFRPEDESTFLEERGLSAAKLGALRVAYGVENKRFQALLDLLVPSRFGSTRRGVDPLVAERISAEGVDGRLPGIPRRINFWVFAG